MVKSRASTSPHDRARPEADRSARFRTDSGRKPVTERTPGVQDGTA